MDLVISHPDRPYTLEIQLQGDPVALGTAFRSLQPEITTADRTLIELNLTGDRLLLTISATDPIVLRAAMNSYMRWLDEALDVVNRVRT